MNSFFEGQRLVHKRTALSSLPLPIINSRFNAFSIIVKSLDRTSSFGVIFRPKLLQKTLSIVIALNYTVYGMERLSKTKTDKNSKFCTKTCKTKGAKCERVPHDSVKRGESMSFLQLPKITTKLHGQLSSREVQKKESPPYYQRSKWKILRLPLRLVAAHKKQRR